MKRLRDAQIADGRMVVGADGIARVRDLTDDEIASGRYPLAGMNTEVIDGSE
jgi:hypothetical protein